MSKDRILTDSATGKPLVDASTGKVLVEITGKCVNCPDCGSAGGSNSGLCCFDGVATPKYLCVTFSGVKRCGDDSVIDDFAACCEQSEASPGIWEGSITLEEEECTVWIDWSGGGYDSEVAVYSVTNVYYHGWAAAFCASPANRIESENCGEEYSWYSLIAAAYDGSCSICNPRTGYNVTPC